MGEAPIRDFGLLQFERLETIQPAKMFQALVRHFGYQEATGSLNTDDSSARQALASRYSSSQAIWMASRRASLEA